ncbi:MAG: DUF1501 domain-containing protein [Planctomycetota bacterium]|nr:MAG: DUF1501 domain-containing protein [Planctomycetota bacterium]
MPRVTRQLSHDGCRDFARLDRRELLRIGSIGLAGLSLPRLLAAAEAAGVKPRAKSILFYHHYGAPSHIDSFDPKPDAPLEIRGEFGTTATPVPGWRVSDIMPQIARVCDRLTVVRTMHHRTSNHNPGVYLALTGRTSERDQVQVGASSSDWPHYGAVLAKLDPGSGTLPVSVQVPHRAFDQVYTCPGQTGGMLGSRYDPLIVERDPSKPDFHVEELSLRVDSARLDDRRQLLAAIDGQVRHLEQDAAVTARDEFYERSFALLSSPESKRAFDLSQESDKLRDRYGRHKSGQSLLLARRLIEAGVRFVTCFSGSNPGDGWDTHSDNFRRMKNTLMPPEDQAFSALIEDMDARGLLDETLVVWSGEFGRKPQIGKPNPKTNNIGPGGRDHWPDCYSLVFAGAGVSRGRVYSESDRIGAYPVGTPHTPADLAATLFWVLGLDPAREIHDRLGRPFKLAEGKPMARLFA